MTSDDPTPTLGDFLRSRRAVLPAPEGRRRVPGWRREEVAAASGVSVDYYIRLEQGRAAHPSPAIIDALAKTLGLNAHERVFAHRLASDETDATVNTSPDFLPSELLDLIEIIRTPAFIMDAELDIRAWNGLAARIIHDFDSARLDGRVNLALLTFKDPAFRGAYDDLLAKERTVAAMLRFRLPTRPGLSTVINELLETSDAFARLWEEWEVAEKQRGSAPLRYPSGNVLDTSFQLMPLSGTDFELAVYTTPSNSHSRLHIDSAASASEPGSRVADAKDPS